MKSINFNTGTKKYAVNGDETNVVCINVNDLNLFSRIQQAATLFDPILSRLDTEPNTPELFAEIDKQIKEKLDYIFGTDLSARVFGNTNCLSPLDDGNLLFMSFFEAFVPLVLEDINQSKDNFAANKRERLQKYLPPSEVVESVTDDESDSEDPLKALNLNEKQIAYLRSLES